ncbi:hypothetical protein SAMN04488564_10161 [Lentzea waywayandensis]|uniref:Uncharacterized protein n=1 Tax=Lentzea waywayandensis TaxID=84724 RepID=A0A1I6CQ26_9PSEU|nr:hypothetical protein [Lentzea waywayandensis]SFQ95257.1 hypothetical protein SAMN04488564_10161 [Lentzea waywayandensis]
MKLTQFGNDRTANPVDIDIRSFGDQEKVDDLAECRVRLGDRRRLPDTGKRDQEVVKQA